MDPLLGVDWAASWRELVERRRTEVGERDLEEDPWGSRAARFVARPASRPDAFLHFLEPWLGPRRTLIDVGAGTGRHAAPLAERLDWVTVVEPSQGMRDRIPQVDNMTVIGSAWNGIVAPAGTPPDVISKLNEESSQILASSETRERFAALGLEPVANTPAEFAAQIKKEITQWAKVIKDARIKID